MNEKKIVLFILVCNHVFLLCHLMAMSLAEYIIIILFKVQSISNVYKNMSSVDYTQMGLYNLKQFDND